MKELIYLLKIITMNPINFWKEDNEPLDCFKVEPVKEEAREDYKNTLSDNIFYWIVILWFIFFIYFIISFFILKAINIEEIRLKVYNQKNIELQEDYKTAKTILKKIKTDLACRDANSFSGQLNDCLNLEIN